ncbi:MAG: polysaccharide pyruvyl transferase family protein [Acutalibacteraceae bacterium]
MKSCIITFQSANNYGAVLQAYALQKFLNDKFCETSILDYHNYDIDKSYQSPEFSAFFKNPKNAVFRLMQSMLYSGKNRKTELFRKEYLPLTSPYDRNTIDNASNLADVFITGSDQVWNYLIVGNDGTYFLDFADNKIKCSYAASFGISELPDDRKEFYKDKISNIDYCSVREEAGAEIIRKLCDRQVSLMPDPTLLVSKKNWEDLCVFPKMKRKYILVYKITKADNLLVFAKALSKKTGLPIIYIPNDLKSGSIGKLKLSVGPQEWLGYIHNAEYVITNSFHGTVFSVLFGKKFFSEVSEKVNPSTSRLKSLLKLFNMEHRTISQFNDTMLEEEIKMSDVDDVLKKQTILATDFFSEIYKGLADE